MGNGKLFDADGNLNLDIYIAYNFERLGFPSNKVLRQEIEYEVQKCILKKPIMGDEFETKLNSYKLQKKQAEKVQLAQDL